MISILLNNNILNNHKKYGVIQFYRLVRTVSACVEGVICEKRVLNSAREEENQDINNYYLTGLFVIINL